MLKQLSVRNYALIDKLELDLDNGFSVITGETGAGKSILLGALGLILGKRADLSALRDDSQKCIIEGVFVIPSAHRDFFEDNDLDYEEHSYIRREITPSGKSRAFVNDTPTTLGTLQKLATLLIDVHSQHSNLLLADTQFQLKLLDDYARNNQERQSYKQAYASLKAKGKELENFTQSIGREVHDVDYIKFLFNELSEAKLAQGEQQEIEDELSVLEHSEEISQNLAQALNSFENNEGGDVRGGLLQMIHSIGELRNYHSDYQNLEERLNSSLIELDDIRSELESRAENVEYDPVRLEKLDQRLSQLLNLQKKHQVENEEELIAKREELDTKLQDLEQYEERLQEMKGEIDKLREEALARAGKLHDSRAKVLPQVEKNINSLLAGLNMPDARFSIELKPQEQLTAEGNDKVVFSFSANKGMPQQPLTKVASGGEMSRVMLALKATMAEHSQLPSIIFDEIDTGVSGETAGKIGEILRQMGSRMQVLAITHLPQIASMGRRHYKVSKQSDEDKTRTQISPLSEDERLHELARLLSGEKITEAALANAKNMLAQA